MERQTSIAIGWLVLLLAFAPGCPKSSGTGDHANDDGGASHATGGGGGGPAQGQHDGSGGKVGSSGSGGHSAGGAGGVKDAGTVAHDAGHVGGGDPHKDSSVPESDGGTPACDAKCETGMHCELHQVVCIKAPCPPVAECVADVAHKFCGGIAAFECPGEGECIDNPDDDCDPNNGGADCGGICKCPTSGTCGDGKEWDSSPDVCACVAAGGGDGEKCGDTTCPAGKECCDALCGKCVEPGMFCTQGC